MGVLNCSENRILTQIHNLLVMEDEAEEFFGYQNELERSPDEVSESKKVSSCVNVLLDSIQFITKDEFFYQATFTFNTCVPCTIEIYTNALGSENLLVSKAFLKGSKQQFLCSPEEPWFDLREVSEFIIVIKGKEDVNSGFDVFTQITCLNVSSGDNEDFDSVQKIMYKDKVYITKDIFGLEKESLLEECAICLSDRKDTVILPCRHLCVCRACASILKLSSSRCPLCRTNIRAVLVGATNFKKEVEIEDVKMEDKKETLENVEISPYRNEFVSNTKPNLSENDNESLLDVIDFSEFKNLHISDNDEDFSTDSNHSI